MVVHALFSVLDLSGRKALESPETVHKRAFSETAGQVGLTDGDTWMYVLNWLMTVG